MDANQYYQSLLQQGHSPENAAHFTSQYYPDFNSAIQSAGMIAPPPDMGLGGLGASSMVAPSGSLATGGVAAGAATTGAAAAGGTSIATIAVVSVLVLGGAGTAGYFIYDYLTEPDFYGVIYWDEGGFGYQFSEEDLTMVFPAETNQECKEITYMFDWPDYEYEDGLCYIENLFSSYEIEDKGDYYKICASFDGENDCFKIYVGEKGLVLVTYLIVNCNPMVSDIEPPVLDEYGYVTSSWMDKFNNLVEEVEDYGPSSCKSNSEYQGDFDYFSFSDRDAEGPMSNESGEKLVHIQMTQGDDLSWAVVKINIVVDGGISMTCQESGYEDSTSDCVYTTDDDSYWSVSEEITISEGATDLCDGSYGGCDIDVTIIKIGIGNEDDKVVGSVNAYADAYY